jgi:hypothetical protein
VKSFSSDELILFFGVGAANIRNCEDGGCSLKNV